MPVDVTIRVQQPTDVASARREAVELARFAGLSELDVGSAGIVVTEAATNLIKHAGGGDIISRVVPGDDEPMLEIIAVDSGKGIRDTARSFEDGYSTAGSPGTGLGAIARLSTSHHVYSIPGGGTVLVARVGKLSAKQELFEAGAISLPYPGETVCGDAWGVRCSEHQCRLTVADGLGHGVQASDAARAALAAVKDAGTTTPLRLMEMMHDRLRSTRGAAVAIADLDFIAGSLTFTGVGNIAGSILHDAGLKRQMVSMNGTVGHEMRKVQTYTYPLPKGSLVILHSDGLSTHWSFDAYPNLVNQDPSVIAGVLMRDFRRLRDDATVVVVRAREDAS
jgi:anti-sigma regulatory factor (Ser/Thr protein kinase)